MSWNWNWLFWIVTVLGSVAGDADAGTLSKELSKPSAVIIVKNQVDINHADYTTLSKLPGLGPKQAELIVNYRQEHGGFQTVNDLTQVKGISKRRVNKLVSENPNLVAKP